MSWSALRTLQKDDIADARAEYFPLMRSFIATFASHGLVATDAFLSSECGDVVFALFRVATLCVSVAREMTPLETPSRFGAVLLSVREGLLEELQKPFFFVSATDGGPARDRASRLSSLAVDLGACVPACARLCVHAFAASAERIPRSSMNATLAAMAVLPILRKSDDASRRRSR